MFSSDHLAISFENRWSSCVFLCFFPYSISTSVCSLTGVCEYSTCPPFSCGKKPKETTRAQKSVLLKSYHVAFGVLWFPLKSKGENKENKTRGKHKPIKESPRRLQAHRMHQSCLLLIFLQEREDKREQKVIKRTWEESNLQNMRFSHGGQEVLFPPSFF